LYDLLKWLLLLLLLLILLLLLLLLLLLHMPTSTGTAISMRPLKHLCSMPFEPHFLVLVSSIVFTLPIKPPGTSCYSPLHC
jgi:hypothetical protein